MSKITTDQLKAIYEALDPGAALSETKNHSWTRSLYREMRQVIAAKNIKEARAVIDNWGNPDWCAKEIRRLARKY